MGQVRFLEKFKQSFIYVSSWSPTKGFAVLQLYGWCLAYFCKLCYRETCCIETSTIRKGADMCH